jgi:hypothetical protein
MKPYYPTSIHTAYNIDFVSNSYLPLHFTKNVPFNILQVASRPTPEKLSHCLKNYKGRHSRFGVKIGDKDERSEIISEKDSYLQDGTRTSLANLSQYLENQVGFESSREMEDDEDSPTQCRNDNLPHFTNDNFSTLLQDRTRPRLTNLSRCLENHTGNQSRTFEVLDGHT